MKYYIVIVALLVSILAVGLFVNQTDTPATQPAAPAPGSEDNALKNLKL